MINGQDAPRIPGCGWRRLDVARPVAIPHGYLDQIIFRQQGRQLCLAQIVDGRADLLQLLHPVLVGQHGGGGGIPLAKPGRGSGIEHRLALEEALDDGGRVRGIEGETVEAGKGRATRHGIKTERVALERCLALAVETGTLTAAAGAEVGNEAIAIPIPAPARIDRLRAAVYGSQEAADVMTETIVVAHLVAEFVAKGAVERDDPAPARAAVHLDAVGVLATAVMGRQLGDHIGMAAFPLAGGAVDAVVRVVYPVRDQLLADTLAHGAGVPAPLARVKVGEQGAVWQHHFRQRQGGILADDQPAGGHRLEIFPVGLGLPGEGKLIAGRGQHADVDGVDEQLARGPNLQIHQFTALRPLTQLQAQARLDPVGWQHGAPGVGRIADAVVLELPVPDPLAIDELELQHLTTGERHLTATVAHRRVVARIGACTYHLALQGGPLRQIDIPDPAAIGGLHLHQCMLPPGDRSAGLPWCHSAGPARRC
ncbi:hypothetical protein D3C85_665470 [compost metagenome]